MIKIIPAKDTENLYDDSKEKKNKIDLISITIEIISTNKQKSS